MVTCIKWGGKYFKNEVRVNKNANTIPKWTLFKKKMAKNWKEALLDS